MMREEVLKIKQEDKKQSEMLGEGYVMVPMRYAQLIQI